MKDLHKVNVKDIPKHDFNMYGAFSCQSYSIAGKRLGFKDKRADIFWKLIEILKYHTPRFYYIRECKKFINTR